MVTRRRCLVLVLAALGGCTVSDVKGDFLADLPDTGVASDGTTTTVTDGTTTTATDGTTTTVTDGTTTTVTDGSTTTVTDGTTTTDDGTTTTEDGATADATSEVGDDVVVGDAAVLDDVPSASDVTLPDDVLVGYGWRTSLPGLPSAPPFIFDSGAGQAVAVPVVNGSAVELRAWKTDGAGLWSATLLTGTALGLTGGAACGDRLLVAAVEADHSKALVASLNPTATTLATISFYPKTGTTSGSVTLGAPGCGGPGAWVVFDAVGAATYKAPAGGTVQLTAEQTLNRSYIVDLTDTFGANGTLGTVSADKIGVILATAANATAPTLFYVGEARAVKQLGASTTLQPGDQLIYAHTYEANGSGTGGTATTTGFFGDNDVRLLAPSGGGRFAVAWRAVAAAAGSEEQRVTAFDGDGKAIGVTVIGKDAPVTDLAWGASDELILAGTFTGTPPFAASGGLTAGTWIAVIEVGATMKVIRSGAYAGLRGPLGLHRIVMGGDCDGDAWAVLARTDDGLVSAALGHSGVPCHSEALAAPADARAVLLDAAGHYILATATELAYARITPGLNGGGP